MKVLVYTFRTFPKKNELAEIFGSVFVFGKLKEDLKSFTEIMEKEKPDLVLGIAADKNSRIEPVALNRFNKGKIAKEGVETIQLFIPKDIAFDLAQNPTRSFCNWTMYRIANHIKANNLNTKLTFIHVDPSEMVKLKQLL